MQITTVFIFKKGESGMKSKRMVLGGSSNSLPESSGMQKSGVPIYHSRPGAAYTLYIDFDGHVYPPSSEWAKGHVLDLLPYDVDGNPDVFSVKELQTIAVSFGVVSENFAPFDIDVTTEKPAAFNGTVGHVMITSQYDRKGRLFYDCNCGGVAFLNKFPSQDFHEKLSPAFVFNTGDRGVSETISHEFGHNLGLSHDGTRTSGYYTGHGSGELGWAPIMGFGGKSTNQWSKGEYEGTSNYQDDLDIIANKIGSVMDDISGFVPLVRSTSSSWFGEGIIERNTDTDDFSFEIPVKGTDFYQSDC